MFGMDMAMGADMMGMGAMDMGIGAMDMAMGADMMAMGNPILGADMMAMGAMDMGIGAMDMGMGMGMMDRGMMMGGMGMGMGMMDRGMMMGGMDMGMMEMGMMGGIGICPPGCMRTCCRPMVVCPPGCMGPCCINRQVIVRTVPNNQYNNNSGFVQLPPIAKPQYYQQQSQQQYGNTAGNSDIQQQQLLSEQTRIQREKNEQIAYKQRLQQEQLQLQKQKLEFEQRQLEQQRIEQQRIEQQRIQQQQRMEQQRIEQMRLQQMQEKQRLDKMRMQQEQIGNQAQYKQERRVFEYKDTFACDPQAQPNPYEQKVDVLFEGGIYQQQFDKWQQATAKLTIREFMGIKIESINKIKVKHTSHVPNTRIIKLSIDGRPDMFIAVPTQDQADWMCRFIWARLNRTGRTCNPNQSYVGCYEGQIVRKSFFSGWELKYASISGNGLKFSNNNGGSVTHVITQVPEIWTRFDIVHGNMLIIKMHASGRKLEIGVPIEHAMVWLKGLYTLVHP